MYQCPVCKQQTSLPVCNLCGFDASSNYEHYPTLTLSIPSTPSIAGYQAKRQQEEKRLLHCPDCGGYKFTFDLFESMFLCLDCHKRLTEEDVRQQRPDDTAASADASPVQQTPPDRQLQPEEEEPKGQALVTQGEKWYYGDGVTQNYEAAAQCFQEAAEADNPHGQFWLAYCYYCGLGLPQDYSQAVAYFTKSAQQNNAPSQFWMGECFLQGHGVSQDYHQAVQYYQQAADQQFAAAQFRLGECYYYGHGVPSDYAKAVMYFDSAAKQDDPSAQYWLGRCLYYGHGIQQDFESAAQLFKKAAEQGYDNARINLGECYQYGRGVKQDIVKAADQYRLARMRNVPGSESAYRTLMENVSWNDKKLLRRFGHK